MSGSASKPKAVTKTVQRQSRVVRDQRPRAAPENTAPENTEVTALLTPLLKDLDALVERLESLARSDARVAVRAGETAYRTCETLVGKLREAEARVSPSRWFG